jgi:hypothetical protein
MAQSGCVPLSVAIQICLNQESDYQWTTSDRCVPSSALRTCCIWSIPMMIVSSMIVITFGFLGMIPVRIGLCEQGFGHIRKRLAVKRVSLLTSPSVSLIFSYERFAQM